MRILLVIESGGGSGRHFVDLAEGLCARGHEVSAIYSPLRLEERYAAVLERLPLARCEVVALARSVGPWDIRAYWNLRAAIKRAGPVDILHVHSSKAGALGRLAASRRVGRVYTPHAFRTMDPHLGRAGRHLYGGAEAALARLTDALIAVSPEEAQHARTLGFEADQIHTVLNGIRVPPAINRPVRRRELGLADDDMAFGFVGRLCAQKDPCRFVDAIDMAARKDSRIKGIMLGDGEMRGILEARSSATRIFSGLNAQNYLPALDGFVLTSAYEGMPYVLVEALHAGLPIISTDVGGVGPTVLPGRNGALVAVDASAAAIGDEIVALAQSPDLRARYAQASRELSGRFSAEKMVVETEAVYGAVLRRRGGRLYRKEPDEAGAIAA